MAKIKAFAVALAAWLGLPLAEASTLEIRQGLMAADLAQGVSVGDIAELVEAAAEAAEVVEVLGAVGEVVGAVFEVVGAVGEIVD